MNPVISRCRGGIIAVDGGFIALPENVVVAENPVDVL